MTRDDATRGVALPFVVAWAVFATYLVAARLVGNLFPLSVFDMYRAHAPAVAARVLALDAVGHELELGDLEGFSCEEPVSLLQIEETCGPDHRPLAYVVRDQDLHLAAHRGNAGGGEPISIVSRARAIGDAAYHDCVIARCTARRRSSR